MKTILAGLLAVPLVLNAAANIVIVNGDPAGVGFNDPTPAAPVGGNTGTTLGQQRLRVFSRAAQIWGAALTSSVQIQVLASWPNLFCDPTSAVLGSAGPMTVHGGFPGALNPNVWYVQALANKLAGQDLEPTVPDIRARFNPRLGQAGCLQGRTFYLGLDGKQGLTEIDFLSTVIHEIGHGLGFLSLTDPETGEFFFGYPDIWDTFLYDKLTNSLWINTSNFVRARSATNGEGKLVWVGRNTRAAVPTVLSRAGELQVTGPASVAGTYNAGPSLMGPTLAAPVSGELMPVASRLGGGNACAPLTGPDAQGVNGKIAVIDRGGCALNTKVLNAQNAGAKAVVMIHNGTNNPAPNMSVSDPNVTIPNVLITAADGMKLKEQLRFRSRTSTGVFATLRLSSTRWAGADEQARAIMYAPAELEPGSSVSHNDVSCAPDQLMEPFATADDPIVVSPPRDLTLPFMRDLGW